MAHLLCTSSDSWNLCRRSGLRPSPSGSKPKLLHAHGSPHGRPAESCKCLCGCCSAPWELLKVPAARTHVSCSPFWSETHTAGCLRWGVPLLGPSCQPWRRTWCRSVSALRTHQPGAMEASCLALLISISGHVLCKRVRWASGSALRSGPGAGCASWLLSVPLSSALVPLYA